jgi:AraC-like DNA-binding protein
MSQTRHLFLFDQKGRPLADIAGGSWDFKPGQVLKRHSHPEDQLLFAAEGVMAVDTDQGIWVVPPLRAVWIPAETLHGVTMSGRVSMRTLYFLPRLCKSLPRRCLVLNISSLLKELIVYASTFPKLRRTISSQRPVVDLILDQLKVVESIPIQLPLPRDARARKLVDQLFANPSDRRPLDGLCSRSGASKRTIQRLFLEETGMSFSKWRQRLRLISAMQRLAAGEAVTTVALETGYNSASAFVAMFRKQVGMTPGHYLSTGRAHPC